MVLSGPDRKRAGFAFALALGCLFSLPRSGGAADGAEALRLRATTGAAGVAAYLAGGTAWQGVAEAPLWLNRTPPLYEGDPLDDGYRPAARVALIRCPEALLVRLTWSDSTESLPKPPERVPDAGQASIYKEYSLDIERFADAACVMVPRPAGPAVTLPSLMMGEKGQPVDLYYWHEVRGCQHLEAAGRSTTTRTGETFPGVAHRLANGWEVVFQLPALPGGTPLAFAVWDGARGQRDGLKYFSLWYEVQP